MTNPLESVTLAFKSWVVLHCYYVAKCTELSYGRSCLIMFLI